ncbi:hypothetical protein VTN77DRAFT_5540 [Rasamsonia byssochlamydoides]|uniref:uncharacterized protein n=1 Tax=Rasamsonia byssochlamydoides TaxID=89139 RepID=UPI003744707F
MGQLGDLSPEGSIAVGVIVGLISTSLQAIGLTLQRKSHLLEDEKDPYDLRRPPYKRRRWQLGMLMFVVSNIIGSTIQITTLPLPVLSTLQASGLVFNTVFATLILGEPFTRYSLIGTVLVCIGAVLIATFGAIGEPAHTLDQLLELLHRRPFVLWMISTVVVVLLTLAGSRLLKIFSSPSLSRFTRIVKLHGPLLPTPRAKLIRGMLFGFVSGVLSAHSLLLAKSAVELLVRTVIDHVNQFNRWQSWVILIGMIALALTQLYYMHRGLKLCSTSVLYPFVFCIYNIIAILDGLIYFRQASQLAGLHAGLIALGTVVLLGGVLCLSWRLEDIDSHTGVAIAGSTQTALGPGMGIVEEHPEPASRDEEMQAGERQPLLATAQPGCGSSHQRVPSLQLTSTYRYRTQTFSTQQLNNESAQIWAELDDSENEVAVGDPESPSAPPLHRSSFGLARSGRKRRTLSFVSGGRGRWLLAGNDVASSGKVRDPSARSSVPPFRGWDVRRIRYLQRGGISRRTSAPVSVGGSRNYGTQGGEGDCCTAIGHVPRSRVPTSSDNPRNSGLLSAAWRRALNFLQRWTKPRSPGYDETETPSLETISHEATTTTEPGAHDRERGGHHHHLSGNV